LGAAVSGFVTAILLLAGNTGTARLFVYLTAGFATAWCTGVIVTALRDDQKRRKP
jgi:hypothetical protein